MANVLVISNLNVLRFVRTDSQADKQNFENRLLWQEDYNYYKGHEMYQIFYPTDPIIIQISTNYATKTIKLVNMETLAETDLTANWSLIKTWVNADGTINVFNNTIVTSTLDGYYYVKITFTGGLVYTSECFHVSSKYALYPYHLWTHSVIGLRKGIYFSGVEIFGQRINGEMMEFKPGLNRKVNDSFNNIVENLSTDSLAYYLLNFNALPRFIAEKINLSFQVDTFKINDIRYELDGEFAPEFKEGTSIYTGKMSLRKVDYGNYDAIEDTVTDETHYILIDALGHRMKIDTNYLGEHT